jgi:hypothetical protein
MGAPAGCNHKKGLAVRASAIPLDTGLKSAILDSFVENEHWASRERVVFAGTSYSKELMSMIAFEISRAKQRNVNYRLFAN